MQGGLFFFLGGGLGFDSLPHLFGKYQANVYDGKK